LIKKYFLLVCGIFLYAQVSDFPNTLLSKNYQKKQYYTNDYELNINSLTAKKVFNRIHRYKAIMNNTYDLKLLLKPLVKPLSNIDTIYLHPNFITTIIFPKSFIIQSADAGIPLTKFSFSQNLLKIMPKRGDDIGNMVVTCYDLATHTNKVFNFILKPYVLRNLKIDNDYGMYATDEGSFFSFTIKYVEKVKVNPIKILEKYVDVFGLKHFNKVFSKNGSYDALLIDNVPVYIIRDDIQGNIYYFNKKFRISIGVKQ